MRCQSYNINCNIQVVVEVFSIMAAYFLQSCCACVLRTVHSGQCITHIHNTEYFNNDL